MDPSLSKRHRHFVFTVQISENHRITEITGCFTQVVSLKGLCYQVEKAPTTGQLHCQCFVTFKDAIVPEQARQRLLKTLETLKLYPSNVEPAKNPIASCIYCQKEDTRVVGPVLIGNLPRVTKRAAKEPEDDYEEELESVWQRFIVDLFDREPDKRTIYWFYDQVGGTGKTILARHLCLAHPGEVLYLNGKAGDMKHAIASEKEKGRTPRMVICNIPRTQAEIGLDTLMRGIEEIKDGIFFSGKYESGMVIIPRCHVVVLANITPHQEALSADRWFIREIRGRDMYARPQWDQF